VVFRDNILLKNYFLLEANNKNTSKIFINFFYYPKSLNISCYSKIITNSKRGGFDGEKKLGDGIIGYFCSFS
jgi:hypothetical protein